MTVLCSISSKEKTVTVVHSTQGFKFLFLCVCVNLFFFFFDDPEIKGKLMGVPRFCSENLKESQACCIRDHGYFINSNFLSFFSTQG